jgi:hypothetical protein
MPTVTVTRSDVPRDEAIQSLRQQLGRDYVVEPGSHDNVLSVKKGTISGAKVHIKPAEGATEFHVHGTGFIIGRLINELTIARHVAGALDKASLG